MLVAVLAAAPLLVAFFRWEGGSLSSSDVDSFFRGRTVDGHYAVAIKKRVLGGENYLVTIHGYPTNFSPCVNSLLRLTIKTSRPLLCRESTSAKSYVDLCAFKQG